MLSHVYKVLKVEDASNHLEVPPVPPRAVLEIPTLDKLKVPSWNLAPGGRVLAMRRLGIGDYDQVSGIWVCNLV